MIRRRLGDAASWAVVLVLAFPLFWMASTAFRPPTELFANPPALLPQAPTLKNFVDVLWRTDFGTYLANSTLVAIATTLIVLLIATPGAYALVAFRVRGARLLSRLVLFTYLLPASVLLIPIYLMIARLGLSNTRAGLVLAYISFVLPFALWLLRSYMLGIPRDLESAAMIDGASRFAAFTDIVLPQALPGIVTTAVFSFIIAWNEYLYALVIINDNKLKTLPTGITTTLITGYNIEWGMVMAASVMMSVPLLVAFVALQRYLVGGFGAGSLKG